MQGYEEPIRIFELEWQEGERDTMSNATTAAADMRSRIGVDDGYGEWSTVTQDQIDQFADLTGDHQWIHSDPERAARETPFGGTIAHGFLTLSLLSHLVRSIAADPPPDDGLLMYINYGFDLVRFISPVPSASRVRASSVVTDVEQRGSAVHVMNKVTVEVEGSDRPAVVAEWLWRLVYDT